MSSPTSSETHTTRRRHLPTVRSRRTTTVAGLGRRAVILVGLAGLAVTQPVLDLLGNNPTFFVAGNYSASQIVIVATVVSVVPALVATAIVALATVITPRLGEAVFVVAVAIFAALFGLVALRTLNLGGLMPGMVGAVAVGGGVAWLQGRSRAVRLFLAYLALGNLAFLLLFVFASPTTDVLFGGAEAAAESGEMDLPRLDGPVVVVVLDEMPVTTILRPDGSINETRYPGFGRLARESTWFRNAATASPNTHLAVPGLLTGTRADDDDVPIHADHPRNYFTLFGGSYPVSRYESVTNLCPSDICEPPPGGSVRRALEDTALVYAHRVLPDRLRADLPPVDQSWGNFADALGDAPTAPPDTGADDMFEQPTAKDPWARVRNLPDDVRAPSGQAAVFRGMVEQIGEEPSAHFVHLVLPHHPWALTPWDTSLTSVRNVRDDPPPDGLDATLEASDPNFEFIFRQYYQLHSLQVGAVDRLVGELIDHLEVSGAWEDSLLVVTADHGVDLTPPGLSHGRKDDTLDEILRIPLFIKAPGQTVGEVRDEPASTLDVLPSIVDLLDIETSWEFDGHSLFDGSEPTTERLLDTDLENALDVVAGHAANFPRGDDWTALVAVGEHADLVGQPVSAYDVAEPSALSWALDDREALEVPSTEPARVPHLLLGMVTGTETTPPELAVAVNGTFAGTVGGYVERDGGWRFSGVMGDHFESGRNEVVAYEVDRSGDEVVLHPVDEA